MIASSDQFVTVKVDWLQFHRSSYLTAVYAKCDREDRRALWEDLIDFSQSVQVPWLLGGDLNVVLDDTEKRGGGILDRYAVEDFNAFIALCGLHDPGFSGNNFTWCNNNRGRRRIWCRLDRMIFNSEFIHFVPALKVQHLPRRASDHCPLLVSSAVNVPSIKTFQFMSMWLSHPDFIQFVTASWLSFSVQGDPFYVLHKKLQLLQGKLKEWNWSVFW